MANTILNFATYQPKLAPELYLTCLCDVESRETYTLGGVSKTLALRPGQGGNSQIFMYTKLGSTYVLMVANSYLSEIDRLIQLHVLDVPYGLATVSRDATKSTDNRVTIEEQGDYVVLKCEGKYVNATNAIANNSSKLTLVAELSDACLFTRTLVNPIDSSGGVASDFYTYTEDESALGVHGKSTWYANAATTNYKTTFKVSDYNFSHDVEYEFKTRLDTYTTEWKSGTESGWQSLTANKDATAGTLTIDAPMLSTVAWNTSRQRLNIQARAVEDIVLPTGWTNASGQQYIGISDQVQLNYYTLPNIAISEFVYSPDGVKMTVTSDYLAGKAGTVYLSLASDVFLSPVIQAIRENNQVIEVDAAKLARIPDEGERLTFTWNPVAASTLTAGSKTLTAVVSYESGQGDMTLNVDTKNLVNALMTATVNKGAGVRCWMVYEGELYEQEVATQTTSQTTFNLLYPFNKPFTVFASYRDGDNWGVQHVHVPAQTVSAHAFNWDGGAVVLWVNKDEPLKEEITFQAQITSEIVNGASSPTVLYLKDSNAKNYLEMSGTATGYLIEGDKGVYGTTQWDAEELASVGLCTYRMPTGRIIECAVTGVSLTSMLNFTEVSVTWQKTQQLKGV